MIPGYFDMILIKWPRFFFFQNANVRKSVSSKGTSLIFKEFSSDYLFNKRPTTLLGQFIPKLWVFPYFLRCKSVPVKVLVHDII